MPVPDGSPSEPRPPAPAPEAFAETTEPPPVVPDHTLLQVIGRGAYGKVWLGRNAMGRYRAIKIVYADGSAQEGAYAREKSGIERFEPLSRKHDGFVDLLQVGFSPDHRYFYCVMELADDVESGPNIDPAKYRPLTLASLLAQQRRLPAKRVMEIGLGLADALAYLHDNRFVHRDVKPSNVVFVDGRAKIADIGLVAEIGGTRSLVGTAGYVPPEGAGTPEADTYALGKVLYEAVTGRDRFDYPELPDDLEQFSDQAEFLELNVLLLRACAADPAKRYAKTLDLAAELRLLLAGHSLKRLRRLERFRRGALIGGAVVLGLGLLGGLLALRGHWEDEIRTRHLANFLSSYGSRRATGGDVLGSLPWYTQALKVSGSDPERTVNYRRRIALVYRNAPRLTFMWFYQGMINRVRFSPAGNQILVAGSGARTEVLDLATTQPVFTATFPTNNPRFNPSSATVDDAAFAADGRELVTGGNGDLVLSWDLSTGQELPEKRLPTTNAVYRFSLHPREPLLATVGRFDHLLRIWDQRTRQCLAQHRFGNHELLSVAYRSDGKRLLVGTAQGDAYLCDATTGKPLRDPMYHPSWVADVAFDPNNGAVVTACHDRFVRYWDPDTGKMGMVYRHDGPVTRVAFNPDGRWIAGAGFDGTVHVWEVTTGDEVTPPLPHDNGLTDLAFDSSGRRLVTATRSGVVRVWDLAAQNPWAAEDKRSRKLALPPAVRADGRTSRLALVDTDHVVLQPDPSHPERARDFAIPGVVDFLLAPRGPLALAAIRTTNAVNTNEVRVQRWDLEQGRPVGDGFPLDRWPKEGVVLSASAQYLARFWTKGKTAELYRTDDGRRLAEFPLEFREEWIGIAFSPDEQWFAVSRDKEVRMYHLTDGAQHTFRNDEYVYYLKFSPDSRWLVVCMSDQSVLSRAAQIWDVEKRAFISPPLRHKDGILNADFSPDQQSLVTVSEDWTGQLWRHEAGTNWTAVARIHHNEQIQTVNFSPDGRLFATGDYARYVRVWDARTGEAVTPPLRDSFPIWTTQFLSDNHWLLALNYWGVASRLWDISPDLPSNDPEDIEAYSRVHSCVAVDPQVADAPWRIELSQLTNAWHRLVSRGSVFQKVSDAEIRMWTERDQQLRLKFAQELRDAAPAASP